MDIFMIVGFFLVVAALFILALVFIGKDDDTETVSTENPSSAVTTAPSRSTSAVTPTPSRSTHASRPTATELLSSLPGIYYGLAIFCGVVLLVFTAANSDELSSTQIGAWIGYTVGAVLSMFAVGRVIELLEQIRNAVRNTAALSPGRSDDE